MNHTALPLTTSQWNTYFKKIFGYIEDMLPNVTYGSNKVNVIIFEINAFFDKYFKRNRSSLKLNEVSNLFEFSKACAALIALIKKYSKRNWLKYVIEKPLSLQYDEMSLLYSAFSSATKILKVDCFEDITDLQYAHFLDLTALQKTLKDALNSKNEKYKKTLNLVLDRVNTLLKDPKNDFEEQKTKGLVSHSDFQREEQIGKGGMALVYTAKYLPTNETVAVKELIKVELTSRKITTLKRELNCLIQLRHPNVINLIGVTVTPPFSILTSYIPNGSLFRILHDEPTKLGPTDRMKIAIGLARGLEYLEAMHTVHRDFKSQNVLLNEKYEAIICDFGLSRTIGPRMTMELGTANYMAPELIGKPFGVYNSSVDTYAFAMTLYELLTDSVPFSPMPAYQIAMNVIKNKARPEIPEGSVDFSVLMQKCWSHNPRDRPKMSAVRKQLEECRTVLDGTNCEVLRQWVIATSPDHEKAMADAIKQNEERETNALKKIHGLNPLDPTAVLTLQQLYQSEIPTNLELFEDLLRLVSQQQSEDVAEISGCILKLLLNREELGSIISWKDLFERMIALSKTSPDFALDAIRLISDRFENIYDVLDRVLALPESHFSLDVIDAIMSNNVETLEPEKIISMFSKTNGNFAIALFRSTLNAFGPLDTFFELATSSPVFLSIYLGALSKRCKTDLEGVCKLLNVAQEAQDDEVSVDEEAQDTADKLNEISIALASIRTEHVSSASASLILTSLIPRCSPEVATPLYAICAAAGFLESYNTSSDLWLSVLSGLNNEATIDSAIDILMSVSADPKTNNVVKVWDKIIQLFDATRSQQFEDAIINMCHQSGEFDVTNLVPILINNLEKNIEQSISILSSFDKEQTEKVLIPDFWATVIKCLPNCETRVARRIGDFLAGIMIRSDIGINADFIATCLNLVYSEEIPFNDAKPFLEIIAKLCSNEDVLIFCAKRHFADFMNQLPWKYPDEPGIPNIISKFIEVIH